MDKERFDREKDYLSTMLFFRSMKDRHLITEEEYAEIDTKMLEKYRPLLCCLFSEKALT